MAIEKIDGELRREQIAEVALNLLAERGLKALSIAAVARRVGIVPSGIYRHFKNKDRILDAVLDLVEQRLTANVQAARADSEDPLARLRLLLLGHMRFIRENSAFPRLVFSEEVHAGHPERKLRVMQIVSGYLGAIAEIVRQGQRQGAIRADADAEAVSLLFIGMIAPAGLLWHLTDGGFDVTRHAHRVWRLFSSAVGAADDPSSDPEPSDTQP